ncbi:MAG: carboxypeptidase PM20D1 [Bermanella sp.]|jgi:carboxypeptidase PM20D1
MKRVLAGLATAIVLLGVVLVVRTLQFGPPVVASSDSSLASEWNEQRLAEGLAGALRFATISDGDVEQFDYQPFHAMQGYLRQRFPLTFTRLALEKIGPASLLFRWEGKDTNKAPVLLLAHQDVVPVIPGTEAEWSYPPFGGTIAEGYIWGRGAVDDKASVLGIFEAVERHLQEGFIPPRTIYLAFGHDEEVGGRHGAVVIAGLLKERGIELAFLLDEGGAIAKGIIPGVEQRVALIGPGEKGYVSLKLSARGAGGHSSMPPPQTAAGAVARAVYRLEQNPFPVDLSFTVDFMRFLGAAQPFSQRMLFANAWLFSPILKSVLAADPSTNAGIRTTTAATMLAGSVRDNVLPIIASAVVNFRILPGETVDSVITYVTEVIADPNMNVSLYDDFGSNPSVMADTSSKGFLVLSEVIRQVSPQTLVAPRLVGAATDARHFNDVAKNSYRFVGVELGKHELAGIHGTDERVSVASYAEAVKIYYALLARSADL